MRFRLSPHVWSTFGQTALLIVVALIVAQVFAFILTFNIVDHGQDTKFVTSAIERFAAQAVKVSQTPVDRRGFGLPDDFREGIHFELVPQGWFDLRERDLPIEQALQERLKKSSLHVTAVAASRNPFRHPENRLPPMAPPGDLSDATDVGDEDIRQPPMPRHNPDGENRPWFFGGPPPRHNAILLATQLADGQWLVGRFHARHNRIFLNPLLLSQIALFVLLLAGSLILASRISRPLRILAKATETLKPTEKFVPVAVAGPSEVRIAISSFNAMAQRVVELLAEKDRMLSAIGHDLRTPLASLRIRAETIEPENERAKFIETINDMTAMVEEILAFARLSHSGEPHQIVDLAALADALVEEFHGKAKFIESPRTPVSMQVHQVRRLLRNLIDNAVKYGENAQVIVRQNSNTVELSVEDDGPGIPPERLEDVQQPFTRLDTSRSRTTGGIGLGLSIAAAIAKSQGANLILENRDSGGLRAIVRWQKQV